MVPLQFPTGWAQTDESSRSWAGRTSPCHRARRAGAILPHCWSAATSELKPGLFDPHQVFSSSFLVWSLSLEKECFQPEHFAHFTPFWPPPWFPSEISHYSFSHSWIIFPAFCGREQSLPPSSYCGIKIPARGVGLTPHSHPVAPWAAIRAASGQHIHSHCNPGVSPKM